MYLETRIEELARDFATIKAQQIEALQLLRNMATGSAMIDEAPVTTDEAARRFGIAKQTLYQNAKQIKHTKRFGRLYFYPADLQAYLNAGEGVANG